MILILSFENVENTTDDIIDWLRYLGGNFVRINGKDFVENVKVIDGEVSYNNVDFDSINVCYFRRFYDYPTLDFLKKFSLEEVNDLSFSLVNEKIKLIDFFWYFLKDKIWFSNPKRELGLNKISVLSIAKKFNLNVPEYLITSKKNDLVDFLSVHNKVITKAISDIGFFTITDIKYNMLTKSLDKSYLKKIPDKFYISFFQRQIIKEYELRVFYFNGSFYTICILSQSNKKTEVDSRNYDYQNPNIEVPYKLPNSIKVKLKRVFNELQLTSCSVDIVKELNTEKYYFLEINPIGQFKNVSMSGNFYIEKEIAKTLIKLDNDKR